jgi:hypothetical protein
VKQELLGVLRLGEAKWKKDVVGNAHVAIGGFLVRIMPALF